MSTQQNITASRVHEVLARPAKYLIVTRNAEDVLVVFDVDAEDDWASMTVLNSKTELDNEWFTRRRDAEKALNYLKRKPLSAWAEGCRMNAASIAGLCIIKVVTVADLLPEPVRRYRPSVDERKTDDSKTF